MKKLFCFLLLLSACAPQVQTATTQVVTVNASSAAQPWLGKLFTCANELSVVLSVDAESPEIYLRLGEPEMLVTPVYKIDEEEILIVTNREGPAQNLTLSQTQELFAQGNPSTQVWVYPSDADMQRAFDQLVMQGRSVSSSARVAVSPQNMSDMLKSDPAAIGILPRHLVTGDLREVFSAGTVPVLAITKSEPQGAVIELVSCLQDN
jgi:hypothetical protein